MTVETVTATAEESMFQTAPYIAPDAIFALTAEYNADKFPKKVNLGQGTYRDENGNPWVLPSVRKSRQILEENNLNHEYLPILGHAAFRKAAPRIVLGNHLFDEMENKVNSQEIVQLHHS